MISLTLEKAAQSDLLRHIFIGFAGEVAKLNHKVSKCPYSRRFTVFSSDPNRLPSQLAKLRQLQQGP